MLKLLVAILVIVIASGEALALFTVAYLALVFRRGRILEFYYLSAAAYGVAMMTAVVSAAVATRSSRRIAIAFAAAAMFSAIGLALAVTSVVMFKNRGHEDDAHFILYLVQTPLPNACIEACIAVLAGMTFQARA